MRLGRALVGCSGSQRAQPPAPELSGPASVSTDDGSAECHVPSPQGTLLMGSRSRGPELLLGLLALEKEQIGSVFNLRGPGTLGQFSSSGTSAPAGYTPKVCVGKDV